MENYPLTTFVLSLKNLKKRSFRTNSLIIIVAVLALSIFCGSLLSASINLGVNYMSGRMAADIMIVPRGCASKFQDTLLRSRANTFYMDESLGGKISVISGIEQVSPQVYLASLNAACCTVPVQIIGFDPSTDFTIKSWMTNINSKDLGFGEVVIGSLVNATYDNHILLFGQQLKVAATLNDTGMGFNSSIFMTVDTAKYIIEMSKKTAVRRAGILKEQISALFIKLENGSDVSNIAERIVNAYPEIDVVISKEMMQGVSSELNNISGFIYGIQTLLWIVSVLVLGIVFTVTANERQREFELYLSLGATRKKLIYLLVTETLIISVLGGGVGSMLGCLIMYKFLMLIASSLGLPYLMPEISTTVSLITISLLTSIFTGVVASINSAKRAGCLDSYNTIREYE